MREGGCTVQAVAVCSTGLWLMGSYLVVMLLGGRVQSWRCRHDGWHCAGSCCSVIAATIRLIAGLEHSELTHVAQVAVTNKENLNELCRLWRGPQETSCLSLVGRFV